MTGRYEFNPSAVTANIEVFPKGEYEFKVGEPKAFAKEGDETQGTTGNYGIRFPLQITVADDSKYVGKRTVSSVYFHSDGGRSFAKQFFMAVLGYGKGEEAEKRFDEDTASLDWGANFDTGEVGEAYRKMMGARVIGILDVGKNKNTQEPMQQFKSWRPLNA